MLSARAAYVVIILFATLSSLQPNWHDGLVRERLARAIEPTIAWRDTIDGLRNILLFAGFGAVWEVTSPSGRLRSALWRATLYGAVISTCVETLQLFSPIRLASILDVATNTGGSFIGAFGLAVIIAAVRARNEAKSYLGVPTFLLALGQIGAVAMEGATPLFRQEVIPVGGGPLTRLRHTVGAATPLTLGSIPMGDLVLSIPAGFLAVAALAELGASRTAAAIGVAIVGTVLAFGSEVAHGATGEVIVWGAVVAHALGIACGAMVATAFLPAITQRFRGAARVRVFLLAYAAVLAAWLWRPFVPRGSFAEMADQNTREAWIPMASLAARGDVFTVGHVMQLFFLMLPVGAVLGAWPVSERGWLRWVLPAVWLSALFELGHIVIAARTFDVTNALIMIAGAWVGWWIVKRAGVPKRGTLLA